MGSGESECRGVMQRIGVETLSRRESVQTSAWLFVVRRAIELGLNGERTEDVSANGRSLEGGEVCILSRTEGMDGRGTRTGTALGRQAAAANRKGTEREEIQ